MKNFKDLDKRNVNLVEKDIRDYWDKIDILKRSIETRDKENNFVFYDGPATANGMPGLHHMVAKFLKDTFCKYAYDIVYWKCRKNATDDSPYWIRALCGEYGEKLIMSTCSDDNQRFVSAYWDRLPVLWAKSTCTWRSFNNVILSERNEYISKLLMTGKFKLTCLNHNGISKLPYFKEWEILLLFEERYHFRTEDWLPDKIFLLDKEDKEIISKEGTHYCVDIKDAQSVVEETRTVIAKAQDEGSSF